MLNMVLRSLFSFVSSFDIPRNIVRKYSFWFLIMPISHDKMVHIAKWKNIL